MRVVEVEGVGEGAVEEGCARAGYLLPDLWRSPAPRRPSSRSPRRRSWLAPSRSPLALSRLCRLPARASRRTSGSTSPSRTGGEAGDLPQHGHRCTTASGRTGEPVPPTIFSGARTNRNSLLTLAASSERFMTSMMWMPYSTSSRRCTRQRARPRALSARRRWSRRPSPAPRSASQRAASSVGPGAPLSCPRKAPAYRSAASQPSG